MHVMVRQLPSCCCTAAGSVARSVVQGARLASRSRRTAAAAHLWQPAQQVGLLRPNLLLRLPGPTGGEVLLQRERQSAGGGWVGGGGGPFALLLLAKAEAVPAQQEAASAP